MACCEKRLHPLAERSTHIQTRGVGDNRTRYDVTVTVLGRFDDGYVFNAGCPKGEGTCYTGYSIAGGPTRLAKTVVFDGAGMVGRQA